MLRSSIRVASAISTRTRPHIPTISPRLARPLNTMSSSNVHHVAAAGFGTGTNELYDRARPSYQPHVFKYLKTSLEGSLKSSGPYNIVEVGSGTGIFTRALLASSEFSNNVETLVAVEPSAGMRDEFNKKVSAAGVSTTDGAFDRLGVPDGSADVVIAAQAFHWCPDHEAACAKFARVLKPHGVLAFAWNLEDRDAAGWVAQLRDTIEVHEHGTPQFRLGLWRAAFDATSYKANFAPPEEFVQPYMLPGTETIAVDRACSKSYISILPDAQKADVVEKVKQIVSKGDGMTWSDKDSGVFEYPYRSYVVCCKKK